MSRLLDLTGQTALVTGASSGIGAQFARQLAMRGADLVLVARRADALQLLADDLTSRYTVRASVLAVDLARPGAASDLFARVSALGISVDILVNNAGFASHGDLVDADPARMAEQVQLNVGTLVETTVLFLPTMVRRGRGAVLNVASTAAFQAVPHMAVYSATKAFVLSFTRALWGETRGTGVAVLAVCPGATQTPFFDVAGPDADAAFGPRRTPEQVVTNALKALGGRRPSIVDGLGNAAVARAVTRILPERLLIHVAERSVRPSKTARAVS